MATTIGFVGLGGMGLAMAQNLQRLLRSDAAPAGADPTLRVYNRNADKAKPLAEDPALRSHPVGSPAELASCGVTFSMLADDAAVQSVFQAYLSGRQRVAPPAVFVDCSTVLPSTTRALAAEAARAGVTYCSCTVFGRPDAAAAARLSGCLAGGTEAEREFVSALAVGFAGRGVRDLGSDASAANSLKLMGNLYIAGQIELAAECLALAAKAGVPGEAALGVMGMIVTPPGPGLASIATGYAERIAAGKYGAEGGFTVELGLKDVGHMRSLGRAASCPLPLADVIFQHLLTAEAKWGGGLDWGAIGLAARDAAGLPVDVPPRPAP